MSETTTYGVTFSVTPEIRKLIEELSQDSGQNMTHVVVTALNYYRGLIDAGEADKPNDVRLGLSERESRTIAISRHPDIARWVSQVRTEWTTSSGLILMRAVEYYSAAIESGRIPRPAKPAKPEKSRTANQQPAVAARKSPSVHITRPYATPTLTDRAECGLCRKQVAVRETGLLTDHIAHPSVRPRGEFRLCDGSGQQPAGPIIHSAETDYRK